MAKTKKRTKSVPPSVPLAAPPVPDPEGLPRMNRPDQLLEARYVSPSQMFLRFADRLEGTWTFRALGLDMSNMKAATIKASGSGTAVEVKSKWGENVQLDSSSLRVLVDPTYAAEIEKNLNVLANRLGL